MATVNLPEPSIVLGTIVRISLLIILIMALFPPWRGKHSAGSAEVDAGCSFLLKPPKQEVGTQSLRWWQIRIDAGRLMVRCLLVATIAGFLITFCDSPTPREAEDKLDLILTHLGIEYVAPPLTAWQELADDPERKTSAIKAYREQYGVGLAEATKAVEADIESRKK